MAGAKRDSQQDCEHQKHAKDHQCHGKSGGEQDAQGTNAHGGRPSLRGRIRQVIGHLANANPEYRHPFMVEREVKRVGYIVVSSDRGLCGGLNINLFKSLVKDMSGYREQGAEIDLCDR